MDVDNTDVDDSSIPETHKQGIRASRPPAPVTHDEPPFSVRSETGSQTDESVRKEDPESAIQETPEQTTDKSHPSASTSNQPPKDEKDDVLPKTPATPISSSEIPTTESAKQQDSVETKRRVAWWIKQGKPHPGKPFKKGNVPWSKGRSRPDMPGNKYGTLLKGIPKSEEMKRKASLAKIGDRNPMKNPIHAKKMAATKRGKPNPKHKEYWRIHHDEQLRKMMVGEHKKPNKLEKRLIELIERNELPFKYVGNWEFILGGKCPDFLNTSGKKLLIELFGNYWHTVKARETVEERVAHFRKYGFETLILWEKEMDEEQLIVEKIRLFYGEI
jgi:very-short-patch-repair endonuclease